MEISEVIKSAGVLASGSIIIQQVIAAFVRAKKSYDAQDEVLTRGLPVIYDVEDKVGAAPSSRPSNLAENIHPADK